MLEQLHLSADRQTTMDYTMFVPCEIQPNEVHFIKVLKSEKPNEFDGSRQVEAYQILSIEGTTDDGDVIFKYSNQEQNLIQRFGFSLKYYISTNRNQELFKDLQELHVTEKMPYALPYSQLDTNVIYEEGRFLDQWTLKFNQTISKQQAIVKVRYSPRLKELIEFEVETSEVPLDDGRSKNVIVQWRFFDGFEAGKTFYTDSNGLEMQKRVLNHYGDFEQPRDIK